MSATPQSLNPESRGAGLIDTWSDPPVDRGSLLTPNGKPCPTAIAREAKRQVRGARNHIRERLRTTRGLARAMAESEAKRFGLSPLEVLILDRREAWEMARATYRPSSESYALKLLLDEALALQAAERAPALQAAE